MKIQMKDFQGIAPVIDPKLLNPKYAMLCHNCNIDSGKLVPYWIDCTDWNWGGEQEVSSPVNEARADLTYYIQNGMLYSKEPARRVYNAKPDSAPLIDVISAFRLVDPTVSEDYVYEVGDVRMYCYIFYGVENFVQAIPVFAKRNSYENIEEEQLTGSYLTSNKSVFTEFTFAFFVDNAYSFEETNADSSNPNTPYAVYSFKPTVYIYFDRCDTKGTAVSGSFTRIGAMTVMYEGASKKTSYADILGYDGTTYARVKVSTVNTTSNGLPTEEWIEENTPDGYYLYSTALGGTATMTLTLNHTEQLETRSYIWTYTNAYGEESPSSDVSEFTQCRSGDIVKVTINNIPDGAQNVYLYRTGGSIVNNTASFYFCKEFTLTENSGTSITAWQDKVQISELAEEHFDIQNPPTDLFSLHKINGSLVAAQKASSTVSGKNVYFSEPYMPYDWDIEYNYTVEHPIVGLEVSGSSVFVLTTGSTVILRGQHPGNMSQTIASDDLPCESTTSITSADGLVYYASTDGLVCVDERGSTVIITKDLIAKEQWQYLNPATMICAVQGKKIAIKCEAQDDIAATGTTQITLIYDISNKTLTTQDYSEPEPAEPLKLKWRSKVFAADIPFAMAAARVITSPATGASFRLLSVSRDRKPDGAIEELTSPADFTNRPSSSVLEMEDRTVTNDNAFRLPKARKELECFVEIDSISKVNSVELATSLGELKYSGE